MFQGSMLEQYLAMSTEFNFLVIDANQLVEKQQALIRELVAQKLDLGKFRRAERPYAKSAAPATRTANAPARAPRVEQPVE
jgi:hypothetical protein